MDTSELEAGSGCPQGLIGITCKGGAGGSSESGGGAASFLLFPPCVAPPTPQPPVRPSLSCLPEAGLPEGPGWISCSPWDLPRAPDRCAAAFREAGRGRGSGEIPCTPYAQNESRTAPTPFSSKTADCNHTAPALGLGPQSRGHPPRTGPWTLGPQGFSGSSTSTPPKALGCRAQDTLCSTPGGSRAAPGQAVGWWEGRGGLRSQAPKDSHRCRCFQAGPQSHSGLSASCRLTLSLLSQLRGHFLGAPHPSAHTVPLGRPPWTSLRQPTLHCPGRSLSAQTRRETPGVRPMNATHSSCPGDVRATPGAPNSSCPRTSADPALRSPILSAPPGARPPRCGSRLRATWWPVQGPFLPLGIRSHLESKRDPLKGRQRDGPDLPKRARVLPCTPRGGQSRLQTTPRSRVPCLGPCMRAAFCYRDTPNLSSQPQGANNPTHPVTLPHQQRCPRAQLPTVSASGGPQTPLACSPSKFCSWVVSVACRARPLSRRAVSSSARLRLARFSSMWLVQQV